MFFLTPNASRPAAVFFDAAGTLFEPAEPVGLTYARIARSHGVRADPARLDQAFRKVWRATAPPFRGEEGPDPDDGRSWWRELVGRVFGEAAEGWEPGDPRLARLFPDLYGHYASAAAWRLHGDTRQALARLAPRFRLLVVSNFDLRLPRILEGLGLAPFFEHVVISSRVGAAKPHPRMFRAALQACGLPPWQCLHAGDDPAADIAGAQAAGLSCFRVRRPGAGLGLLAEKLTADDFPACIGPICD